MRISEIRNSQQFQDLCQQILAAEYADFQVLDDSGGDKGSDGYVPSSGRLFAMYCPEKHPTPKNYYQRKIHSDLAKAVTLRDKYSYQIKDWIFITPAPLTEELHRYLTQQVEKAGFAAGSSWSEKNLLPILQRHPELESSFPDLFTPNIRKELSTALALVGESLSRSSEAARRLSPNLGSVLTLSEVRGADASKRRKSVGDVVQWGRLLDGVYAPRPELLRCAIEECLTWIANIAAVARRRHLPVFWIDGRSGDGKSVLLFQLAQSILSARPEALVYQAARPDTLPAIIDHAQNADIDGRLILILAEDLHRVTDLDTFQAALKLTLDRDQFNVAVLACGPTPEKDAFVETNPAVEVSAWTMPSLSALEVSIFSDWFDTRIEATDTLERTILVEVLFASQIGAPVTAFAKTFGHRLRTFGVFETVRKIVAINALDIGAPAVLFGSVEERDSIERLARKDQLHFEWKEESWGLGVRLTHRMIAWKLFDEWSADFLRDPSIGVRLARVLSSVLHISELPNECGVQLMSSLRRQLGTLLELDPTDVNRCKHEILDELVRSTEGNPVARCFPVMAILAEYISNDQAFISLAHIALAVRIVADANTPASNRTLIAAQLSVLEFTQQIVSGSHRVRAEALVLDSIVGSHAAAAVQILVAHAGSAPTLIDRCFPAHWDPKLRIPRGQVVAAASIVSPKY